MSENIRGYVNVYNELKTMHVAEGGRELSGDEVIFAAYILLKMQQYDDMETYDDFWRSWEENHSVHKRGFWAPQNSIGMSFDPEACEDSNKDKDATKGLGRWETLKQLKNVYHNDELINCILFGKIDTGFKMSRTPYELSGLAMSLLEIKETDSIADFSTGENVFFRDCFLMHPNNRYFVYKADEDYAEAIFVRACTLGLKIENDFCVGLFDDDAHQQGYDKIFLDFNRAEKREGVGEAISEYVDSLDPSISISNLNAEWYHCMTAMKYLKEDGKMVAIVPRAFLGNKNNEIARQYFLNRGYIENVISLPERLYEDTIMPTAMIVFSRGNKKVTFVDAAESGYSSRYGARRINVLSDLEIGQILSCIDKDTDKSKVVCYDKIYENKCSLNPKTYLFESDIKDMKCFGDVITKITRGVQLSGAELDELTANERTEHQYVTPASIQYGGVYRTQCYLKHIEKKHEKYVAQPGDILITKNIALFKVAVVNQPGLLVSGNLYLIRIDKEKINPYFVKLFLESESGQRIIRSFSSEGAATILSVAAIKNIPIPNLSISEQQKLQRQYEEIESEIYAAQRELEQLIKEQSKLLEWI